jgi:glycosyltransferase involved in cell wall biosynthesis
MNTLYIIMPAYNEAENILRTINEWYPVIESHNEAGNSRLIIIDDGSKDDTYSILQKAESEKPLMKALTKPNSGHGPTLIYGYNYALSNGADYIFQTDSDGQTNPLEFESFWNRREKYDALFGNRMKREDGKSRVFVEKTLCRILKLYYRVRIPDANAPFRLMKAQYVREYLSMLPENYNLPNVMLTTFGAYYKKKIKFVPISFKPRQGGINSINIKRIILIGKQALKDFREIKKRM